MTVFDQFHQVKLLLLFGCCLLCLAFFLSDRGWPLAAFKSLLFIVPIALFWFGRKFLYQVLPLATLLLVIFLVVHGHQAKNAPVAEKAPTGNYEHRTLSPQPLQRTDRPLASKKEITDPRNNYARVPEDLRHGRPADFNEPEERLTETAPPPKATPFLDNFGGPVYIVKEAMANSRNLVDVLFFGVLVSLLLVTTNALPIYPFDGGRIVEAVVMRFSWFPVRAFRNGGFVLVLSLVGLALLSDAVRLLGYIFK